MPISRYQIRNPYGLADPDLYRSADRDDPEAILEGVAMAGLVGILRQLGDLAEFAAEIFRDLHEDVMATAARGHGLMIRVQQVEAEFPSVERALLSQTIHSNFAKNAGVEWHANLKIEHNLITTGDMQRFIMDSYEECRGPPRLFLLDKFDIAGAGACLKRCSDPSFFKTEFSQSKRKKAEVQRETKARKIKKRGARWRNGDTSEMFSTHFNSTLRQLFSDETEIDSKKVPIHAVKLKRKHLNGSSFNSVTGRSYMECVLETCSPKHAIVRENSECNTSDLASEIHQINKVDFASKLQIDRNWISSPNGQEILGSSLDELDKDIVKEQSLESLPKPTDRFHDEILSSTLHQISQNYVTDDDERRMEARDTEVEEISSDIRQADEKDGSLNEQSKIEDDGSKNELDKLPPSYLQIGQKGALFDIKSRIEICLDGYRSAGSEEDKNTTIYPEDQRDAFDGKNKAEDIDDGYGTDNVARNSSFIHPIDQKELPDGKGKTEANDDLYGSDNADKNHAVIYTTDHDGYEFYDVEKNHAGICPVDQKDSLLNGESKPDTCDDGHGSNDAASELDNYMDALTTMESEMETDTENRAKHEKSFLDVVTTETYYDTNEKRYDVHPDVHPVEDSSTSYDLNSLLKKQRSSCSDSLPNLADAQILEGKGIAPLDAHEKFNKSPKFEDAMPGPIHRSSSFVLPDKSPSPSNGDAGAEAYLSPNIDLTEVQDATPDELTSCDGPGTKSPQSFLPSSKNDRISEISHFISVSGEISWSSCITDAAASLIHSSSGASLNEIQLVATDPSEISSVNIEAMGNHSGDDILLIPEVSSHCPQMEDLVTATFAKCSTTGRMLDGVENALSESGLHFSDILNMSQRMKDAQEDCSGAAGLTSGHLDVTLGDLQATFESHLSLQTPESAVPEKALTDDASTASVGENLIMLDLPLPVEDKLLSLSKCDIDACSAILLPPECLAHVRTDPIDTSPCGLNSEEESTGRHSSCAVGLPNSIELPEHEQTSDILPYKSENSNMKSHNNILDQADASAMCIETETSLYAGSERLCGAPENQVKVVPVNLQLKSPVDDLPVEFSAHSDDMATRSAVGLSICNDDGPTIDSRTPSDHPRLLEEESLSTEVALDQHKIEMSEPPNQEDNIAFNGQNLTALSDNEANELLMHATDPAATAEPCQPDSQDFVVSEFLDGVHHTMPLQGTVIHPHSSGVLNVPLLSRGGSQDLEQKLRESNQPVGPKSPDLCHPCKDEKDAVSPSTHFNSEPSIPLEQILDAMLSHDKECLEPADHLFERKKSLEEMVPPVIYEADCFDSHPDSSLVDQLIQQLSESKLRPESLVVAASSFMNEPTISSLGVPRNTILKSEAQMQLPPSHYYQTSESSPNLLNSAVAGTPSPISPSIGMLISETAHELQPNMPMLAFPLSEPNLQSHEMEDMPPLPPLPPLEWRIGKLQHNSLPYGGQTMHSTDPFLPPQINGVDRTQRHPNPFLGPQTVDTDNSKQPLSPFGLMPAREDEKNQGGSLGSITVQPLNSYFPLPNTDNKKSLLSSQPVEEVRKHPPKPSMLSVFVEDEKWPHDLQTSEDRMQQSVIPLMPPETKEDQKANDKMQSEHTQPRDPLIEAVAAHDRSMLRRVSKRFQNETTPKLDERDSFLGQIRAKSFNLKPTTSVKPIIQGPRTNLNVVAILEKANAIRQAFAGSDEDNDSDSWSDS